MQLEINSSNSFGAKLKSEIYIPNKKRFNNINKRFQELTTRYPEEILYLYSSPLDGITATCTDIKSKCTQGEDCIYFKPISMLFKTMSDDDIAKVFAKTFNFLKIYNNYISVKQQINKTKLIQEMNETLSKKLQDNGNIEFSKKYKTISILNKKRISTLENQLNNIREYFIKLKENLSNNIPEIKELNI